MRLGNSHRMMVNTAGNVVCVDGECHCVSDGDIILPRASAFTLPDLRVALETHRKKVELTRQSPP